VSGLPAWGPGYQFTHVGGGWAVQPGAGLATPGCAGCAGSAQPVYYLADGASAARLIGKAYAVAPGASATAAWLTSYPTGANPATATGLAQQVSLTASGAAAGGVPASRPETALLGPPVRLPAGYLIVQGTSRGLLLTPVAPRAGQTSDELWVPGATRASRVFTGVIAASPGAVAWTPPCTAHCGVRVLDLATGRVTFTALPSASSAASAAFSPDGRYLALQVSYSNNGDDGALAMRLAVLSMPSGRLTVVPQTFASSDALAGFGWPAAGDTLVAELSFTTKVQLAAWRPGAARLAVATLNLRRAPSLVLGPAVP
jgi:hypothetical protein